MDVIGETDWLELENYIYTAIDNIYKYRNSVVGILETVQSDYSNLKLDVKELYEQMADKVKLSLSAICSYNSFTSSFKLL